MTILCGDISDIILKKKIHIAVEEKDVLHRRMPVIIFIIPLPSAEMSLFRYSLRSKYIIR